MTYPPRRRRARRGTTIVEAALILTVLLSLILGIIDLGLCVMRFNMISHAAREGVRQAMVHGQYAIAKAGDAAGSGAWAQGTWTASTAGQPLVAAVTPHLIGCDLTQTNVTLLWVDGTDNVEQRVRVTITTTYQPFMTTLFGAGALNLKAASTARFAH